MSSFQKVIKYIAISLAMFIIFNIISLLINGVSFISGGFSKGNLNGLNKVDVGNKYEVLDIELTAVNIFIKEGKKFKIETDSDNLNIKEVGNKLLIIDKKTGWLPKKAENDLVIYVPKDYIFDEVLIENGVGRLDVDYLNAKELELELGAGQVNLNRLNVVNFTSIDSGAGEVVIKAGSVNNLDLDMGIGKVKLNLEVIGNSEIDAGIGELNLVLLGNDEDYKINVDKGIGNVEINGESVDAETTVGNGDNIIDIDGGVGNINVDFRK